MGHECTENFVKCLNILATSCKPSESMVNLIVVKVVCVAALAGGVFLFGLLPILFTDINKGYLSLLVSFSGGVLLGTTLLHLLPEVGHLVRHLHVYIYVH